MILEDVTPSGGVGTIISDDSDNQVVTGATNGGYIITAPGGGGGGVTPEELATELEGLAALIRGNAAELQDFGDVEAAFITFMQSFSESFASVGTSLSDMDAKVNNLNSAAVTRTGNQTISGEKTFNDWVSFNAGFNVESWSSTRDLMVQSNPGDTARIILNNVTADQLYEFGVNTGGVWSVWNSTDSVGPLKVYPEAPDGALILGAGSNFMSQDLDMEGHKVTDLATPTAASDAATKAYADTKVALTASPNKIYGTTSAGNPGFYDTNVSAVAVSLPLRDANGQFRVGAPTEATHVSTKQYVDNAIAAAFTARGL